jgi:hypothetical protein
VGFHGGEKGSDSSLGSKGGSFPGSQSTASMIFLNDKSYEIKK